MATTLKTMMERLPAGRRKNVEERARELVAEEMTLRDLRKARDLTQERLAELLQIGQDSISRLERRSDLLLSTLQSYVEAMGGTLELIARFPDRPAVVVAGLRGIDSDEENALAKRGGRSAGAARGCSGSRSARGCGEWNRAPRSKPATLDEAVSEFTANDGPAIEDERRWFGDAPSLSEAIKKAASSKLPTGKLHPHQWRVGHDTLGRAAKKLLKVKAEIGAATTFDELHSAVEEAIGRTERIGDLAVYDIADRIGAYLGIKPDVVYSHCGTREGLKALGVTGKTVPVHKLPPAFQHLSPGEAENCLCLYKEDIKRLAGKKRAGRGRFAA